MPKIVRPLSIKEIKSLRPGTYAVGGAPNLYVRVKERGRAAYLVRIVTEKSTTHRTIGHVDDTPLPEVRKRATEINSQIQDGRGITVAMRGKTPKGELFEDVARKWVEVRDKSGFYRNDAKGLQRVNGYLKNRILPAIGHIPVDRLSPHDVFRMVVPFYQSSPDAADKCLTVVRNIYFWAKAQGHIVSNSENPADRKGTLGVLLEPYKNRRPGGHHPALAPEDLPAFMAALHGRPGMSAKLLEFTILTCLRSKMARNIRWEDVDLKNGVVEIPETSLKMKGRGSHFVFLSRQAKALLLSVRESSGAKGLVFKNLRGGILSDVAALRVIEQMHEESVRAGGDGWIDKTISKEKGMSVVATGHGIARATFKTWCRTGTNRTELDDDAVELCLAHRLKDDYQGAYNRAELEPERRKVMQAWSDFCFSYANLLGNENEDS